MACPSFWRDIERLARASIACASRLAIHLQGRSRRPYQPLGWPESRSVLTLTQRSQLQADVAELTWRQRQELALRQELYRGGAAMALTAPWSMTAGSRSASDMRREANEHHRKVELEVLRACNIAYYILLHDARKM